jgi:hypothetical protein
MSFGLELGIGTEDIKLGVLDTEGVTEDDNNEGISLG